MKMPYKAVQASEQHNDFKNIHKMGLAFNGTKSGRSLVDTPKRAIAFRVSLQYELTYDDVIFVDRDVWEKYGIPNIFGDDQLVFYTRRNRNNMILIHKLSIIQIEARQI